MEIDYSDSQKEKLFSGIHSGDITPRKLPKDLYHATADNLKQGVFKGYGGLPASFEYNSPDRILINELQDNIYAFSAAKTYQQVREMSDALHDGEKFVSFKEFKEKADEIFGTYNKSYLESEYSTALATSQNARAWNEIESTKDALPNIMYHTNEDDQVCEICAPLDGITLPVDDGFWDDFMPPNHYQCGCYTEQLDEDATLTDASDAKERSRSSGENMDDMFKMNPGKDGVIFKEGEDGHPYFSVAPKDEKFAQENFGLEIPKND